MKLIYKTQHGYKSTQNFIEKFSNKYMDSRKSMNSRYARYLGTSKGTSGRGSGLVTAGRGFCPGFQCVGGGLGEGEGRILLKMHVEHCQLTKNYLSDPRPPILTEPLKLATNLCKSTDFCSIALTESNINFDKKCGLCPGEHGA